MTRGNIQSVIIDLSGVLYTDDRALPGSVEALKRLTDSGVPHCFLTNTTRQTRQDLQKRLQRLGFDIGAGQLMTAAAAAHSYVRSKHLRPHLLIHPDLTPEFDDLDQQNPNAVVVGDAGQDFNYQRMNTAFRVLMQGEEVPLIAMGANRYFKESDGLSMDMGPFVSALEYASDRKAIITGKPAEGFFRAAMDSINAEPQTTAMIGDDLENDIGGAQTAGIAGILVRTGKYRPEDEQHPAIHPDQTVDNFAAAVDWILNKIDIQ